MDIQRDFNNGPEAAQMWPCLAFFRFLLICRAVPDTSKEAETRLRMGMLGRSPDRTQLSVRCPCVEWNEVKPDFHPFRLVYISHML